MPAGRRATARRCARAFAVAALAVAAAACASAPAAPIAGAPPSADLQPARAAALPPPVADANVAIAAVPAATGARALVGIGREALVARLGPAAFVRRDGPAEVWRYQTAECYFEAFLYRDNLLGQRVAHVDARARQGGRPVPPDPCLASLTADKSS